MCSYVTALLLHIGIENAKILTSNHSLSTNRLPAAIDDVMKFTDDESNSEDDDESLKDQTTVDVDIEEDNCS